MAVVFKLQIQNLKGLHARAASYFVKEVGAFQSDVWVEKDGQKVSGRSIMGLMMLGASKGTTISVSCSGVDEKIVCQVLTSLVNSKFHEKV